MSPRSVSALRLSSYEGFMFACQRCLCISIVALVSINLWDAHLVLSGVPPATQTRFVSISTGSDTTGDGNQANPWKNISFALSQITDASDLNRYELRAASGTYKGDVILKPG